MEEKTISKKRYDSLGPATLKIECKECGRYIYGKSQKQASLSLKVHQKSKMCVK